MILATEEIAPEALFREMSLRELAVTASDLNAALSTAADDNEFLKTCQEYITDATTDKVDGYSFVAAYLEADIAAWQEKKQKLLELVDKILHRKQRELELLKSSLLKLHQVGLIPSKLDGKTRTITIQASPPKVTHLRIPPDSPEFPEQFREVRVEYKINAKALIEAWKAGEDISTFANIEQGTHVRFRHKQIS